MMESLPRNGSTFPEALLGSGCYKLGYATTDRERAIEVLSNELGIETFKRFEPAFLAAAPGKPKTMSRLKCAWSVGRPIFVEVMQPIHGEVDIWRQMLPGNGFQLAFHHVGVLVDDVDRIRAEAGDRGIELSLDAERKPEIDFVYLKPPSLPHYIEVAQMYGAGETMIRADRWALEP